MSRLHHEQLLNYTQLKYLNRLSCCHVACGSESVHRVFVFVVGPQSKRPSLRSRSTVSQAPVFQSTMLTLFMTSVSRLPLTF